MRLEGNSVGEVAMTELRMARSRIGMLTPSSNTVLEPVASAILRDLPEVSLHCSRLRVTEISLAEASLKQFELEVYLAAAQLLTDARVHVVGWNGTSASWLGFGNDRRLCQAIRGTLGVDAATAVLAINELLEAFAVKKLALVTPYVTPVQNAIIEVYTNAGYECVSEYHFGEHVNYSFAEIGDEELTVAIRKVADAKPDAVVVMCTNLRAAHLVDGLESDLGIPVIDSIAAFVWKATQLCGARTDAIRGWGQLFSVGGTSTQNRN